jgi:hypothetical protein
MGGFLSGSVWTLYLKVEETTSGHEWTGVSVRGDEHPGGIDRKAAPLKHRGRDVNAGLEWSEIAGFRVFIKKMGSNPDL